VSYAPLFGYCNMFSIYYLEIIASTKLVSQKLSSDAKLGKAVNYVVMFIYFFLTILTFSVQIIRNAKQEDQLDKNTAIEIYFTKNWFYKQQPFQPKEI
jgi:hypothetical protein